MKQESNFCDIMLKSLLIARIDELKKLLMEVKILIGKASESNDVRNNYINIELEHNWDN